MSSLKLSVSHSVLYDSLWPHDCNPPGSSAHGIFQACWCWVPFPTAGDIPDPGIELTSLAFSATWDALSLLSALQ